MSVLSRRILAAGLAVASVAITSPAIAAPAEPSSSPAVMEEGFEPLNLGAPGLTETRTQTEIVDGVTHTVIRRGNEPAEKSEIGTTQQGPWRINVLSIDPRVAKGELVATHGENMAAPEQSPALSEYVAGIAGVNAGFFTFSGKYPGEAAGLYVYEGEVLSQPTPDWRETSLILSSQNDKFQITKTSWEGHLTNKQTGKSLEIENLNHPPVAPDAGTEGDLSFFTDDFSNTTPALNAGFEVVLDKNYCVTGKNTIGGTALAEDEYAIQATGSDIQELKALLDGGNGCLHYDSELTDENGKRITLNKHSYAVNGRVNLIDDGTIVAEKRPQDPFYVRHPRTIAGITEDGTIKFIVIDGRSTSSVGATIQESAQVAQDLGLVHAINLDGGGSSTMSINGDVVNVPSGDTPRSVGDALVWVPAKNE